MGVDFIPRLDHKSNLVIYSTLYFDFDSITNLEINIWNCNKVS
jgi:hypothetical protein